MEILYHFTSASGLKGIVESGNLHATHIRFLNDSSEFQVAKLQLITGIATQIRSELDTNRRFSDASTEWKNECAKTESEAFYSTLHEVNENRSPIFVTSFTEHDEKKNTNDGALSQWRAYGVSGGYCIAFEKEKLLECFHSTDNLQQRFAARAARTITYVQPGKPIELDIPTDMALYFFKQKYNGILEEDSIVPFLKQNQERYDLDLNSLVETEQLINIAVSELPFLKNYAFEEEKEFRLSVAAYSQSVTLPNGSKPPKFLFRTRGETIIPYLELFPSNGIVLPIHSVIVGPHRMAEVRKRSIEVLLKTYGYKSSEVRIAQIPYESTW